MFDLPAAPPCKGSHSMLPGKKRSSTLALLVLLAFGLLDEIDANHVEDLDPPELGEGRPSCMVDDHAVPFIVLDDQLVEARLDPFHLVVQVHGAPRGKLFLEVHRADVFDVP